MKKIIAFLLMVILTVTLFGCSTGGDGIVQNGNLVVSWVNRSENASLANIIIEKLKSMQNYAYAGIITDIQYSYVDSPLEGCNVEITAEYYDINGNLVPDADMTFTMQKYTAYDVLDETNNTFTFDALEPGTGTMQIEYNGETAYTNFKIYDSAAIGNNEYNRGFDFGYDFENDINVATGDIFIVDMTTVTAPYGYYTIPKDGFWRNFHDSIDAAQYTYTIGTFDPSLLNRIYFIRTANGGYAKLFLSLSQSAPAYNMIFEYSPDGQF